VQESDGGQSVQRPLTARNEVHAHLRHDAEPDPRDEEVPHLLRGFEPCRQAEFSREPNDAIANSDSGDDSRRGPRRRASRPTRLES